MNYFEENYSNLIYTTNSTDWSQNFELKYQAHPLYPHLHFMFTFHSRLNVNLRRKTQLLCANKVRYTLQRFEVTCDQIIWKSTLKLLLLYSIQIKSRSA